MIPGDVFVKKLILFAAAALVIALVPKLGFTEDQNTVRMAKVIYAMAGDASYEVKLAVGGVIMNRVQDPWFPATLEDVLKEKHQFPAGSRYDEASLSAARDAMAGRSGLAKQIVFVSVPDGSVPSGAEAAGSIDGYTFFEKANG